MRFRHAMVDIMGTDKVHIVMAADDPYMKGLEVAKTSMITSCSDPARLEFHIFGENPHLDERIRNMFGTYKGSSMAFLRLYLGELLPNVDWIVYSDVDTLWRRDVLELSKLFDSTKTIQWVRDLPGTAFEFTQWCNAHGVPSRDFRPENYCCSGVCIINLRLWRERNVLGRCREFVTKYGCPKYADQDILNAVLANEAGMLPDWWDVLIPTPKNTPRCVLHLTGVGRCFERPYGGKVMQYHYWEHVARGKPFPSTWTLPFYMHRWMIRLCLPFSNVILHDRIQRYFAWRWFLKHEILAHVQGVSNHRFLGLPAAKPRVWIDLSCTASKRAGLAMHTPGRKVLKWAVRILGWCAWLPIEKIVRGPIKRFDELDGHEAIEKVVSDLAVKDVEYLTLYMGNDSMKSKLTVLVSLSRVEHVDRAEVIVKLGRTIGAAKAIRNEVDVLKKLADSPLRAQVPVAIGKVGSEKPWTWSIQSVLPKGKSPVRMQKEHYAFLDELRRIGISHGDFAPWNCSIVGGKLYVWDWEDACPWQDGKDESWFKSQVKKLLGVDA